MTDLTFSACQGHPLSFINGKFFNLLSVCQNPGGRKRAKYMYGFGPFSLGATGSIYTEHPQKVRSSQCVTKQVDRKSSTDRTGRVGLPGVTDDYPPTIYKKGLESGDWRKSGPMVTSPATPGHRSAWNITWNNEETVICKDGVAPGAASQCCGASRRVWYAKPTPV